MKNTKLTLKSLKHELENIKLKSKPTKPQIEEISKGPIGHDIKNSYVNRLYMRSGAMWLFLITGLVGYISKLPFIGKLLTLLGFYYRKSTFLQILIKIRKGFVIFNALIGVYLVFKSVGFSTDNLIVGFIAMGETYIQTLLGLTSKLFHWFVELFDHKIVPNVPGDNGGTWFSKPIEPKSKSIFAPSNLKFQDIMDSSSNFSLRELYKNATPQSRPWYSFITDTNTWWWFTMSVAAFGVIYFGYQVLYNPMFDIFHVNPRTNVHPPTPPINPDNVDITLGTYVASAASDFSRRVVNIYNTTINSLNPFTYFITSDEVQAQFNAYMEIQNDMVRANRRLYPFTENNPLDPWYKKLRLQFFGESGLEFIERNQLINKADAVYNSLKVGKGKAVDTINTLFSTHTSPWNSPALSPMVTTLGLNSDVYDAFNRASVAVTEQKLSSIPNTPSLGLTNLWGEPSIDELDNRFRRIKNPSPSTSSNATIIAINPHGSLNDPTLPTVGADFFL